MNSFLHFLQYHNAVPIALGIIILGSGATFAATNPEAIYSEEHTVLSVDNTYIAEKDLSGWTPIVKIDGVTEDSEYYYVAYTFSTIALEEYVWKDVSKNEVMNVSKPDLGPYRDLGLYVMAQLSQKIDREIAFLKEVQEIEKRNVSQKMVATAYGGLVGALLNDTTEVVPNYVPVVVPPTPPPPAPLPEGIIAGASASNAGSSGSGGIGPAVQLSGDDSDTEPPYLQILGANPVLLQEGDFYLDLGVVAADHGDHDAVEVSIYLNGAKKERIYFEQAPAGEWTVTYEAKDRAGNISRDARIIKVLPKQPQQVAPAPDSTPSSNSGQASSPQAESAPAASPEPTPSPEPEPTPAPAPEPAPPAPEQDSTPSSNSGQASSPQATPEPPPPPAPEPSPPPSPEPAPATTPSPAPPSETPAE